MDIQNYIDEYIKWLKNEITFSKVGEYYEINTPFLDNDNDYLQFYVKTDGNEIYFTDDGYTLNSLEMSGFQLSKNRKIQLDNILKIYGVKLNCDKELTLSAALDEFPQKKHAFTQCLIHVSDMYMISRTKTESYFFDDIQDFLVKAEVPCIENVMFTGKSGFQHSYDFAIPHSKNKPERLCLAINNPGKSSMVNAIFAWNDTKPSRRDDSHLIVFLNDSNSIGKGIENGFLNYDVSTIRWSERHQKKNIDLLIA